MKRKHGWMIITLLLEIALVGLLSPVTGAGDWPMYRGDAARSGYSPDPLPAKLELRWVQRGRPPAPSWPTSLRVTCDFAHQPIISGATAVWGSSTDDSVVALDLAGGRVRWRFFTAGPVRFAPAAWRDRVFVASDDGCLYALALADGRLLWKHRGGPNPRLCQGNGRMISRWPARGGPVVLDDTVYYAAGIWPSDGVYLHALEAASGAVRWSNDRAGGLYLPQPHGGANAFSGVTPQGYLLAGADRLFVPTGRAVPAAFRRDTGEFEYYRLQENGSMGGARAVVADRFLINGGCFLERATGKLAARAGRGVFSPLPDGVLQFTGDHLRGYRWSDVETRDRKGAPLRYRGLKEFCQVQLAKPSAAVRDAQQVAEKLPGLKTLFRTDVVFKDADESVARQTGLERMLAQSRPDVERLGAKVGPFLATAYERTNEVIAAGQEAICGTENTVAVVDLAGRRVRWSHPVDGAAVGLAAARGVLLVATAAGALYCFAEPSATAPATAATVAPPSPPLIDARYTAAAAAILQKTGVSAGICLDLGCEDGELALALVRCSQLQVIGIEDDPVKVERARQRLAQAGVYGSRVTILEGPLSGAHCPRNCANLIVSSRQLRPATTGLNPDAIRGLLRPDIRCPPACGDSVLTSARCGSTVSAAALPPYGGVACWGALDKLEVHRRGPLDGAGQWTHQNADAANTLCSADRLVRGPLEMAWFRDAVLEVPDRHAQSPAPLFSRGHLVVAGVHGVCALDAYNGCTRWVFPIPNILSDWDGVHHDVGVGDCGSNLCLSDDAVFVRTGPRCLKIDLATGRLAGEFQTPVADTAAHRDWGYVAHADGLLYGTVLNREHTVSPRYGGVRLRTESVLFFAMDAHTGKVRWQYQPEHSLRNNAIAIAGGRVYLIDRPLAPADRITEPKPDGKHRPALKPGEHPGGTLLALDAHSGAVLWRNQEDVFGTQLAASAPHGVLVMYYQAVKHNFFRLPSEVGGRMAAFATATGARLWDRPVNHQTRPIINGDVIYAEGGAWQLKSGEPVPWNFKRSYGCGQIAGSCHLLLFRSATLGYWDLSRDAGTENFGGIRPSCWFNAIPAGGLVLVPDGSFQCACSYQTQAWLALQPRE